MVKPAETLQSNYLNEIVQEINQDNMINNNPDIIQRNELGSFVS